jgi:hypothetical protein
MILLALFVPDDAFLIGNSYFTNTIILQTKHLSIYLITYFCILTNCLFIYL